MPDDIDDDTDTDTGADTDTGSTGTDDGAQGGTGDDTGTGDTGTKDAAKTGKAPDIQGDFDKDRAARLIARLRSESATEKAARQAAETKTQDTLKAVAKALGLADEDKPDPEKLTAQLEEARAAERQRRTELQVLRLAPGLGADADALLDSQAFAKTIAGLDPAGSTFREDVEDAIRDMVGKHARYKAATVSKADDDAGDDTKKTTTSTGTKKAAGKSGADMSGAGGKPQQVTAAELAKMTPQEIVNAQDKGLLNELLGS